MPTLAHRVAAVASIAFLGLAGAAVPAQAEDAPATCDQTALNTAVGAAAADARAAQKAYTTHTRTSMQTLVAQLKNREVREATLAARKAARLEQKAARVKGPSSKEARAEAKAARVRARQEAKEAARIRRAARAQLVALVKKQRVELKAAWDAAKAELAAAKAAARDCEESTDEPPADGGEDSTGTENPTG